jgi:hypothetical protein
MIEPSRHVPLRSIPSSATATSAAIEEIVADAIEHFDAERFWPSHLLEDGRPDGMATLFRRRWRDLGLDYPCALGCDSRALGLRWRAAAAARRQRRRFVATEYSAHGALLLGDLGVPLVAMRIRPSYEIARPGAPPRCRSRCCWTRRARGASDNVTIVGVPLLSMVTDHG